MLISDKIHKKFITILLAVTISFICSGCGERPEKDRGARVVARINDYELTATDFRDEVDPALAKRYLSADPLEAKKELLEEIIIKKILIQEAEKQNFDKNKAFMKEIEQYWEQALLKLLIGKKAEELSLQITVPQGEVVKEYERMLKEEGGKPEPFEKASPRIRRDIRHKKIEKALEEWVTDLRKKTKVTINEKVLGEIEIGQAGG